MLHAPYGIAVAAVNYYTLTHVNRPQRGIPSFDVVHLTVNKQVNSRTVHQQLTLCYDAWIGLHAPSWASFSCVMLKRL